MAIVITESFQAFPSSWIYSAWPRKCCKAWELKNNVIKQNNACEPAEIDAQTPDTSLTRAIL